jgi:GNAT superfamily N-acetyltransferase
MTSRDEITIAPASAAYAAEIATLYLASRAAALPYLRRVHSDADTRRWIETVMLACGESWVAHSGGTILGFVTLEGANLEQLYLRPGQERRGIGSRLLAQAKARSPGHLRLYTFQRNSAARAFYEARSFRIVETSDGSRNEEGEPDILYEWRSEG